MMKWFWELINTPAFEMTPLKEFQLTLCVGGCGILIVLGIGCMYYAISGKK